MATTGPMMPIDDGNHGGSRCALRVAVLASGRGSNFLALAAAIADGRLPGVALVGVFSDKPSAPVLQHASELALPAVALSPSQYPDRASFDAALFAELARVQPDLIVCAGYMRIIGAAALRPWVGRMINIHPSLLPEYPGLHTHRRALRAGARVHGASVHFVTAELDGGPVIAQARVAVQPDDSETSLAQRVLQREHPLLVGVLAALARGELGYADGVVMHRGQPLAAPLQLAGNNLEVFAADSPG